MNGASDAWENGSATPSSARIPATLVLLAGALVLLLRRPLPLDEIRYLQVLHESQEHLGLLTLMGKPYAEKTPLLMWLAWLISRSGLSLETSLRLLPALCSAGTVVCAQRLGRRLGLASCGWLQAAMLLPFLYSQVLLFDPLLTVFVWVTLLAWSGGRDRMATCAAALAFLAKGPVAVFFLVPWAWALAPLRPTRTWRARLVRVLALGILPLAAWALGAGMAGGASFQRKLWWERWAGRLQDSFAHGQPAHFYIQVILVGALPLTPLLIAGAWDFFRSRGKRYQEPARALRAALVPVPPSGAEAGQAPVARLAVAGAGIFLVFSFISGKQPHYLLPLAPVLALCAATLLERSPTSSRWLWVGVLLHCSLGVIVFTWEIWGSGPALERYMENADALGSVEAWTLGRPIGLATSVICVLFVVFRRPRAIPSIALTFALTTITFAPIHVAADRLVLPRRLEAALQREDPATPIGIYGNPHDGLFQWLSGRSDLQRLNEKTMKQFLREHPGGLLITTGSKRSKVDPEAVEVEVSDVLRSIRAELLRVREPAGGQPRAPR